MNKSFAKTVETALVGDRSEDHLPTTRLDNTVTKKPRGYTRTKLILCGDTQEVYSYEHPIRYGFQPSSKKRKRNKVNRSEEYRADSIIRAINRVRQLTHLNFKENDKFLTLTFNNDQNFDITDLASCLPLFQKAMRKLRKQQNNLKYIVVPEFQKRGAVHYHVLCNLPFVKKSEMSVIWPYGFFKPRAIKSTTHLALYLSKYLSKKFDDKRKKGHKLFYTSHNLVKPITVYEPIAEEIRVHLETTKANTVEYEKQYPSAHNGLVTYRQYLASRKK